LALNKHKHDGLITYVMANRTETLSLHRVLQMGTWSGGLGFVGRRALFDRHVLEFTGLKDIAAFQTLDVLGVLIAADNLHARVLTLIHVPSLLGGVRQGLAS